MVDLRTQIGLSRFRIDVHQEKAEACHREMKVRQEMTEAAMHSIWTDLEETIKCRVEDVLTCDDQRTQDLCKENNEKIIGTQMDLQAIKGSHDTPTNSFQETTADTRKKCRPRFNSYASAHAGLSRG
jgi:hypothetical protein